MSAVGVGDETARPRLVAHRRLRYDKARKSWMIQAPERVFLLDEIAYAIVSRCDGAKTVREIVDELCAAFEAPRNVVAGDVQKLVQDFVAAGVMAV